MADKYEITSLKETALARPGAGRSLHSASDSANIAARTQDLPLEQKRLDQIALAATQDRFMERFRNTTFRDWLAARPKARGELFRKHAHELLKVEAFHEVLKEEPALAIQLLRCVAEHKLLHDAHSECRGFYGCKKAGRWDTTPSKEALNADLDPDSAAEDNKLDGEINDYIVEDELEDQFEDE